MRLLEWNLFLNPRGAGGLTKYGEIRSSPEATCCMVARDMGNAGTRSGRNCDFFSAPKNPLPQFQRADLPVLAENCGSRDDRSGYLGFANRDRLAGGCPAPWVIDGNHMSAQH